MFTSFNRIIKMGWRGIFHDGGMVAAEIFIMSVTISLISSLFLFGDVSRFVIKELQDRVDIAVYFSETAQADEILSLKEELMAIPEVKEVVYVSKDEALEKFSQRHENNPVLMESLAEVGGNPFLSSLDIKAFEASQYEAVAGYLESPRFGGLIEKVDYYQRKPVIERIFSLTSGLSFLGVILSLILAFVAVLVAFNSVRLAIYNSREEIKIQRLVGASNWFIRGPFLVQGAISGVFAALIALLVLSSGSWIMGSKLAVFFPGLNLFNFFVSNFWAILLIQLATGIGLGVISSSIAVRKYLSV